MPVWHSDTGYEVRPSPCPPGTSHRCHRHPLMLARAYRSTPRPAAIVLAFSLAPIRRRARDLRPKLPTSVPTPPRWCPARILSVRADNVEDMWNLLDRFAFGRSGGSSPCVRERQSGVPGPGTPLSRGAGGQAVRAPMAIRADSARIISVATTACPAVAKWMRSSLIRSGRRRSGCSQKSTRSAS